MNVPTYIYLGLGFTALLPFVALLARRPKKAAVTTTPIVPFFPEAVTEDVTLLDDGDDDDTIPYIRLPFFFEEAANVQEDVPALRVSNWP